MKDQCVAGDSGASLLSLVLSLSLSRLSNARTRGQLLFQNARQQHGLLVINYVRIKSFHLAKKGGSIITRAFAQCTYQGIATD